MLESKMIKETSGDSYEEARSLNQQLTFNVADKYFADAKIAFGQAQKRSLHLINEDGTYANLAMLLSDQCITSIKLAVFEGSQKTVFHDRKELQGSLLKQFSTSTALLLLKKMVRLGLLQTEGSGRNLSYHLVHG